MNIATGDNVSTMPVLNVSPLSLQQPLFLSAEVDHSSWIGLVQDKTADPNGDQQPTKIVMQTKDKRRRQFTFSKSKKAETADSKPKPRLISRPSDFQHVSHVGQEQMGGRTASPKLTETLKTQPASPRVPQDYYRVGTQGSAVNSPVPVLSPEEVARRSPNRRDSDDEAKRLSMPTVSVLVGGDPKNTLDQVFEAIGASPAVTTRGARSSSFGENTASVVADHPPRSSLDEIRSLPSELSWDAGFNRSSSDHSAVRSYPPWHPPPHRCCCARPPARPPAGRCAPLFVQVALSAWVGGY